MADRTTGRGGARHRRQGSQRRSLIARLRTSLGGVIGLLASSGGTIGAAGVGAAIPLILLFILHFPWPGPGPGPTPPPQPPAVEITDFIVGVTDNDAPDRGAPHLREILNDGDLAKWLDDAHIGWRLVDIHSREYAAERYANDLAALKVAAPAGIRYSKGKAIGALPATSFASSDAVKLFIKGQSPSMLPLQWDAVENTYVFDDAGHKRFLTRLDSSKASLVRQKQALLLSAAKTLIPRDQWKSINRRDFFAPASDWILDQNGYNSCVGNGAVEALRKQRKMAGMFDVKLSPGALYAQINGNRDAGAVIGDSMTALMQNGTCSYDMVGESPFYLRQLPAAWKAEASRFKIDEAYITPTFDEIATAIQLGYTVCAGVMVGNNFNHYSAEGIVGAARGPGNHCIHFDGMTKLPSGKWALDMANSWGASWGPFRNGRGYMTEEHFLNGLDAQDFYAIRTPSLDPRDPNKPVAKLKSKGCLCPDCTCETCRCGEAKAKEPSPATPSAPAVFAPPITYTSPATAIISSCPGGVCLPVRRR